MTQKINQRDKRYDFIRFVATLMILLHHFCTTCVEKKIPFPSFINDFMIRWGGGIGVGLFFLLSGAVIWTTTKTKFSPKQFYKKRFIKILIPHWIAYFVALLITYVMDSTIKNRGIGILISFSGLNYSSEMWKSIGVRTLWLVGEWFTAVIILVYLAYPLLRFAFIKHRRIATIIIALVFIVNLKLEILSYGNGWFSITNGFMYFWLGMLFQQYKEYFQRRSIGIISLIGLLVLFIINPTIKEIPYLPVFISSLLLFVFLYQVNYSAGFIRYICRYNYEIYLVHHRVFLILIPFLFTDKSNGWQKTIGFFLLVGLVFLLAQAVQTGANALTSCMNSKSPKLQNF